MSTKPTHCWGPSHCTSDLASTVSGGLLQSACKVNRKDIAELQIYLMLPLNPIAISLTPSHMRKHLRVASSLYPDAAMPYRMDLNTEPENTGTTSAIQCSALLHHRQDKPQHRPIQCWTVSESVRTEHCNARLTEIYNALQNQVNTELHDTKLNTALNTRQDSLQEQSIQVQSTAMPDRYRDKHCNAKSRTECCSKKHNTASYKAGRSQVTFDTITHWCNARQNTLQSHAMQESPRYRSLQAQSAAIQDRYRHQQCNARSNTEIHKKKKYTWLYKPTHIQIQSSTLQNTIRVHIRQDSLW